MNDNFNYEKRIFNSSSISDYMECPQMWERTWIRRLELKEEKEALVFGSVMHEALLEWYKTGSEEKALKKFERIPLVLTESHMTRGWGQSIFKEYVRRYSTEVGKTLHLEVKGRVEIGERIYAFTIDRIEDWDGNVYVDDHKTTKNLGLSFFESFRPSPQIDGYCFACKEIVGRCHGAIINGISKAKNPKERFQRFPSSRTEREMEGWKKIFTDATDGMVRCVESGNFPMHTVHCHRWGKCKYWEMCVYGEDERFMEQKFRVKPMEVEDEEGSDTSTDESESSKQSNIQA